MTFDLREWTMWAVWRSITLGLKLLYHYRVEGLENVPEEGPLIFVAKEGGGAMSTVVTAVTFSDALAPTLAQAGDSAISTMHEDLFVRIPRPEAAGNFYPLRPHGAGVLSVGLVHQLQSLRAGGIAVINPEGDLSWDGRLLPVRPGAAWLGLHTAATIVPMTCSMGTYDIWPLWQRRPSLRGRIAYRIGRPFQLTESPMTRVSPEDVETASARIAGELNALWFSEESAGTEAEWAGPPTRDGKPATRPSQAMPRGPVQPITGLEIQKERNWGIPLYLWSCPVCRTHDALVHHKPRLGPQTVACQACGTKWRVRRAVARDFRLEVLEGHPDLVGLEMALTNWYDQMMTGFEMSPLEAPSGLLGDDEELYLIADRAELLPHDPSPLGDDWPPGEAPRAHPGGQGQKPSWSSAGEGRLYLTNRRILWEGERGQIEFLWPVMRSVFLPWQGIIGITYGSALYRFDVSPQPARKWMTYAGTLAREAAAVDGHKLTLSPF